MSLIVPTLESILGSSAVVAWEGADPQWRAQVVQAIDSEIAVECIVYPSTQAELAEVVTCASQNHWRALPCGSGSKLHWGGLAEKVQMIISTSRLNRLVEHASGDLTVTAEAGMGLANLQSTLATAGQFLAIDPAYAERATLGGIVATADTGALRQRYGGIRDILIGLSMVRSDGKMAKSGGRVVKNVAGYDLMKLLTGSYGTLGILAQLTFRIYPLPAASQTLVLVGSADLIAQATATLFGSALTPTAMDLLTPALVTALEMGTGMGLAVRFQNLDVSVVQQSAQVMQIGLGLGLNTLSFTADAEANLWRQLSEQIHPPSHKPVITCKIGVEPAHAVDTLRQIDPLLSARSTSSADLSMGRAVIHAGSGLGSVCLPLELSHTLPALRQLCQAQGGFLTILAAPLEVKRQIEVWGYSGNALSVMQRLKTQFDPDHLLSPHRFVGNI